MYIVLSITKFGLVLAGLGDQQCAVHHWYEALCVGDGVREGREG